MNKNPETGYSEAPDSTPVDTQGQEELDPLKTVAPVNSGFANPASPINPRESNELPDKMRFTPVRAGIGDHSGEDIDGSGLAQWGEHRSPGVSTDDEAPDYKARQ